MEQLSQAALQKLARDLKDLQANAVDGVKVQGRAHRAGRAMYVRAPRLAAHSHFCKEAMFAIAATSASLQVLLNDDNLADIQAEYEGPGTTPQQANTCKPHGFVRCSHRQFKCVSRLSTNTLVLGAVQLARHLRAACSACGWPSGLSSPTHRPRVSVRDALGAGQPGQERAWLPLYLSCSPSREELATCVALTPATFTMACPHPHAPARILPDQDLPPQCVGQRRDLRQRAEARLEARPGPAPRAHRHSLPADRAQCRVRCGPGGGRWDRQAGEAAADGSPSRLHSRAVAGRAQQLFALHTTAVPP